MIPTLTAVHPARTRAEAAARQRLLNAFLRETGTPDPRHDPASGTWHVPLPATGHTLHGTMTHWSPIGLHDYAVPITVSAAGTPPRDLDHDEFVTLLLAELATRTANDPLNTPAATARERALAAQIANSVDHTATYLAATRPSVTASTPHDRTRIAEQSVLLGHPLHPTPKSAEGFSADDLAAYAPELGTTFRLHYLAVAPELVAHRRIAPGDWLPSAAHSAVRDLPVGRRDFVPIPVHPWQVDHLLRQDATRRLVRDGVLEPLGPVGRPVYPTSSVRTVCDPGFGTCWKLPLHVRITNFVRTNPPEQVRRALDASAMLAELGIGTSPGDRFHVLLETGSTTVDVPELAADFAVLYRDNPFATGTGSPQVLAGLLDPGRGTPLLLREVRAALGRPDGPLPFDPVADWLRRYLSISLVPLLDLFTRHGVSVEAHVQNSLVQLESGWPTRCYVRDMEGTSISRTRVTVPVDPASPALYDDATAWHRFRYYVVTNHLGHLLNVLSQHGNVAERALWTVVAEVLREIPGNRYAAELLTAPTLPAKANLTSRFAEHAEHPNYVKVPNPIREDHR